MSDYIYACVVVCPVGSAAIGNALADSIDPNGGGELTFTDAKAIKCYPAGTTFTRNGIQVTASAAHTAYAAIPPLKQTGYDAVNAAVASGNYPQIAVLSGLRADVEPQWRSFIESLGYVIP